MVDYHIWSKSFSVQGSAQCSLLCFTIPRYPLCIPKCNGSNAILTTTNFRKLFFDGTKHEDIIPDYELACLSVPMHSLSELYDQLSVLLLMQLFPIIWFFRFLRARFFSLLSLTRIPPSHLRFTIYMWAQSNSEGSRRVDSHKNILIVPLLAIPKHYLIFFSSIPIISNSITSSLHCRYVSTMQFRMRFFVGCWTVIEHKRKCECTNLACLFSLKSFVLHTSYMATVKSRMRCSCHQ